MDKIERAKELFNRLEENGAGMASDVARRSFFIQQRLSEIRA